MQLPTVRPVRHSKERDLGASLPITSRRASSLSWPIPCPLRIDLDLGNKRERCAPSHHSRVDLLAQITHLLDISFQPPAQRFYPQCSSCSSRQGVAVRNDKRTLMLHFGGPRPYHAAGDAQPPVRLQRMRQDARVYCMRQVPSWVYTDRPLDEGNQRETIEGFTAVATKRSKRSVIENLSSPHSFEQNQTRRHLRLGQRRLPSLSKRMSRWLRSWTGAARSLESSCLRS